MNPALADSLVTITATGPSKIAASSLEPTGRITALFAVNDSSLTASGATICKQWGTKKRQGCDYRRFDGQLVESDDWDDDWYDDDEYTQWIITGTPGQWNISYPIGFEEISREECLYSAWQKDPKFSATIEVLNDAGTILSSGSFNYEVSCTGIEGGSVGPEKTRVYAGKSTKSKPFDFFVVDAKHMLKSYRVCNYSSITGKYFSCDRESLTKRQKSDDGWVLSYTLTWNSLGSATCNYIGKKWPQSGFRIELYDAQMDKVLSLFRGTRLDC